MNDEMNDIDGGPYDPDDEPNDGAEHGEGRFFDRTGQGKIVDLEFVRDLLAALDDPGMRRRYVELAIDASKAASTEDADAKVLRWLTEADDALDTSLRDLLDEANNRPALMESLRVMGIRLRRTANLNNGAFSDLLGALRRGSTW